MAKKTAQEEAETKAKEERKIQRAITTLKNKQLKEDRAVVAQIARESRVMDTTTQKVLSKKSILALNRSTKTSSLGKTIPKPLTLSVSRRKSVLKGAVTVILLKKVVPEVVVTNRRGRQIKLLSRYD